MLEQRGVDVDVVTGPVVWDDVSEGVRPWLLADPYLGRPDVERLAFNRAMDALAARRI